MSREQQNKASLGFAWVFQDYSLYKMVYTSENHPETQLITEYGY